MAIVRYTAEELKKMPSKTDWVRVKNMRDADIDYSDCPDVTELLRKGLVRPVGRPPKAVCKKNISLRIEAADLRALRRSGKGWQTRVCQLISYGLKKGIL
ncbi:MAG: BrnA antitoxin family protein [Candidatus Margulisbacteria bacterium]|jgi:uncharacterized protein (DUF4415 family)|nr:BrnA antitoxin family protein [Candidatus Margulisiibacteriota bacterium]